MVGNPGVGKSTLLNGMCGPKPDGSVAFKAGVSIGTGLTTTLQRFSLSEGVTFYDTPGLADTKTKKQAGEEISKLLEEDRGLKLIFVVTLEEGRVRPQDSMTIDLVLSAIELNTNDMFCVIVNKLEKKVLGMIKSRPQKEALMRKQLTDKHRTSHWMYVERVEKLAGEDDQALLPPSLNRFVLTLPDTKPRGAATKQIDTSDSEQKMQEYEAKLASFEMKSAAEKAVLTRQMKQDKRDAEALLLRSYVISWQRKEISVSLKFCWERILLAMRSMCFANSSKEDIFTCSASAEVLSIK